MSKYLEVNSSDWVPAHLRGWGSMYYIDNTDGGPAIEYSQAASPTTAQGSIASGGATAFSGSYLWLRGSGSVVIQSPAEWAEKNTKTYPVYATSAGSGPQPQVGGIVVSGSRPTIGQQIQAAFAGSPEHDQLYLAMGDSTGNEPGEYIYLYAQRLAAALPNVRVLYRLYDDTNNRYGAPVVLSEGSGSDPYVTVGADGRGWAFFGTDVGAIGTDLDVRVDCALTAYTGVAEQVLVCQYGAAGARVFRFYIQTSGLLGLEWKTDGTNGPAAVLSTVAPTGLVAGQRTRLRATLDVDNGAGGYDVKFYQSADGLTWTQVGTTVTVATATSLYQTTGQVYEIGSRGGSATGAGAVGAAKGTFYGAHASGLIDGGNKLPISLRSALEYSLGMDGVRGGGPCLHFFNGSIPGSKMSYQLTAPRTERMIPRHIGTAGVILSSLHNEGPEYKPSAYITDLAAMRAAIEARIAAPRYALCTQNPQFSPRNAVQIFGQAERVRLARSLAKQYGWDVVDTFPLFTSSDLVQADGIHPVLATGSALQAEEAWRVCGV